MANKGNSPGFIMKNDPIWQLTDNANISKNEKSVVLGPNSDNGEVSEQNNLKKVNKNNNKNLQRRQL